MEKDDALNRARWRVGVGEIAVRVGIHPDQNWTDDDCPLNLSWLVFCFVFF